MPTMPTLASVIMDGVRGALDDVHTCTVAKVVLFDPMTETVNCQLQVLKPVNDAGEVAFEEPPILPDVPIAWPQGGGYAIKFPIKPGDFVLLVFSHESIAMWRETGTKSVPPDLSRHSLGNGIAIPGILPTIAGQTSIDPTHLASKAAGLYMGKEGTPNTIEVSDAGINLGHMAIAPVALAPGVLTAMAAIATYAAALTTAAAAGAAVPPDPTGAAFKAFCVALAAAGGPVAGALNPANPTLAGLPSTLVRAL